MRLALGELTGHHVIRMRLAPLSLAAVEMLAGDSGREAELLHKITGGNPFFVREVLASPGELVPETVRDAVLARLVRCSAATRELAEFVAVSPGRTETWLIESVLGVRQMAVDEAGARGLLVVQSDAVGYRHEIVSDQEITIVSGHLDGDAEHDFEIVLDGNLVLDESNFVFTAPQQTNAHP